MKCCSVFCVVFDGECDVNINAKTTIKQNIAALVGEPKGVRLSFSRY